jgi:tRNA G18 (ribose-2'-O)-methylase SpoU
MLGKVESLNAAVAGGILLYEIAKIREQGRKPSS